MRRKLAILIMPLAAALFLLPAYSGTARQHVSGPADVRQLTFESGGPSEVITEFAVASPDGRYFVTQRSEDPKPVTLPDGSLLNCRHYFVVDGTVEYVLGFGANGRGAVFDTFDRVAKSLALEKL